MKSMVVRRIAMTGQLMPSVSLNIVFSVILLCIDDKENRHIATLYDATRRAANAALFE